MMFGRKRRWRLVLTLSCLVAGILWCGWRWWDVRRYRNAMERVQEAMAAGRNGLAARELANILTWRPDSDEADYLLGMCEKARGRTKAASDAWSRVPVTSSFGGRAILGRTGLLLEGGRLADAEQLVEQAAEDRRSEGSGLWMLLVPVLCQEGRVDAAERLIEARWEYLDATGEGASEQAINLARLHMELHWNTAPVESLRAYLDQVARVVPDDDRLWLGRANLAIRSGAYDEAALWLDACLRRRPEDASVWRARLDWAMATNRVVEAQEALKHLPVEPSDPAQLHRVAAWLATRRGDVEIERRELQSLVAEAPEDFAALDRLVKLSTQRTRSQKEDELRRRKQDVETLQARYRDLYKRNQPSRDAIEMARLAERLGRHFEAKVFLTAAIADEPGREDLRRDLARLNARVGKISDPRRSLFDVLAVASDTEQPADLKEHGRTAGP